MAKIDTSNWGEFKIGDLFETQGTKTIRTPTGANVPTTALKDGKTPRITVTAANNGVSGYYNSDHKNYRTYENFISVSFLGTVFYQKDKSSLDMKVHALKPVNHTLSDRTGIFLSTIIKKAIGNISYADQISSELLPTLTIPLPQTPEGTPDWAYMEAYMEQIRKRVDSTVSVLEKVESPNKPIDTSQWGDFKIGDLFEMKRGQRLTSAQRKPGKIPYYSASSSNNGITDMISNPLFTAKKKLVVSTFLDVYWAEKKFTTSDEITMLSHPKMNEKNALFVATCIKALAHKYNFKNKAFSGRLAEDTIKLPQTSTGEPDWAYMEAYMDNVRKRIDQKVAALEGLK